MLNFSLNEVYQSPSWLGQVSFFKIWSPEVKARLKRLSVVVESDAIRRPLLASRPKSKWRMPKSTPGRYDAPNTRRNVFYLNSFSHEGLIRSHRWNRKSSKFSAQTRRTWPPTRSDFLSVCGFTWTLAFVQASEERALVFRTIFSGGWIHILWIFVAEGRRMCTQVKINCVAFFVQIRKIKQENLDEGNRLYWVTQTGENQLYRKRHWGFSFLWKWRVI